MPSKQEKKLQEARNKFLGIEEKFSVKSYYPQLKEKIETLEQNEGYLKDKSRALLSILEDLEAEKKKTQESEEKFRFLAENSRDMIYRMSLPDCVYEYVSPASKELTGYTPEEFYSSPLLISKVIHPEWHEYFKKQSEAILNYEEPRMFEYKIINKNGDEKWINQRNSYIYDENGKLIAMQGIVNDITKEKIVELELKESEKKYRTLVNSSSDSILLLNNGYCVDFNEKTLEMFCITREDILNKRIHFLSPEFQPDGQKSRETIAKRAYTALDGQPQYFEWVHCKHDGSMFYTEVNVNRIYIKDEPLLQVVIHDITQRKKTELELEENRQLYQQLVDSVPLGIYRVKNTSDGLAFIFVSERFCEITDLSRESILANPQLIIDFFIPEDQAEFIRVFKEALITGEYFRWEGQASIKGETRWIHIESHITQTAQDSTIWTGIVYDITDRKKTEEALRKSEEQLRGITQNIPGMVFQFYVGKNGEMGISYLSDLSPKYLGLDNSNLEGAFERFSALIVEEDRPEFFNSIKRASESLTKWEFEGRYIRPDGKETYFRGASQPRMIENQLVYDGILFDITEQKNAERKAKQLADMNLTILDTITVGLTYVKDRKQQWTNMAFGKIFGYDIEEISGVETSIFYNSTEDYERIGKDGYSQLVKGNVYSTEIQMKRKDGNIIWCKMVGKALLNTEGAIEGSIWMLEDITEQKQAELSLQKNEAVLKAIMESINEGILFVSSEGELTHFNKRFKEIFSVPEELLYVKNDKTVLNFVKTYFNEPEEFNNQVIEIYKTALPTEDILYLKDGRILERYSYPMMEDSPIKGRVWSFRDITEKKKSEETLYQKEAKLNSIFKAAPVGIGLTVDRIFQECNDTFLQMVGYTASEIIGQSARLIYPTEEEFVYIGREQIRQMTTQSVENIETRWLKKDGVIIDVLLRFSPLNISDFSKGVTFTAVDITKRKEEEKALRDSEEKFVKTFQSSPAAMVISEIDTGRFIDVNESWCKMLGYSREEMIGRTSKEVCIWVDNNDRDKAISRLIKEGSIKDIPTKFFAKDGEVRDTLWSADIVLVDEKNVMLTFIYDYTERKKAEDALRESEMKARLFIEHTPLPIAMLDKDMRYMMVSKRWNIDYNLGDQPLIGRSHYEVFPEVDENEKDNHKRVLAGEVFRMEAERFERADGSVQWLRYELHPWKKSSGEIGGLVMFTEDITERRKVQETLRENEERLRLALSGTNQGLFDLNLQTGKTIVSDEYLDMIGYKTGEIDVDLNWWRANIHPEDINAVDQTLMDYTSGKKDKYRIECRVKTKSGNWKWILSQGKIVEFSADGKPLRMLGTHIDITEQKKAEEALIREQTFTNAVLNSVPGLLYLYDFEGNLVRWNKQHELLTGYSSDELNNMHLLDWYRGEPEEANKIIEAVKRIPIDGHAEAEAQLVNKDGSKVYYYFTAEKLTINNKDYFVGVGINTAERKKAEIALSMSEEKFSKIFRTSPDSINIIRLADGVYLETNQAFTELTGYTAEEVVGKSNLEIDIWADPNDRVKIIQELNEKGELQNIEVGFKFKNGTIGIGLLSAIVIDLNGEKCLLTITRDITERKKMEETLRINEERLRLTLAATKQGIFDLNLLTGKAIVSKEYSEMLGYEMGEEDFDLEWWSKNIKEEDFETANTVLQECIQGKCKEYKVEFRLKTKEGNWKWVLSQGRVEINQEGKAVRMLGTHIDITERKHMEEEIRQLNESLEERILERTAQLEAANKELEAFSYSVSHDLRAPLRAIDGFGFALQEDYGNLFDDQAKDYLDRIRNNSQKLSNLIDDILRMSRVTRQEIEKVDVNLSQIAEETYNELTEFIKDREIEFCLTKDMFDKADPRLIKACFQNLIDNAIKFTSKKQKAIIEIGFEIKEDKKIYYVKDNGAGFDERYTNKLFGVFQRLHTQEEFKGTGVGLATVHRIIRKHGGSIWAKSEQDKGATFYFTLK